MPKADAPKRLNRPTLNTTVSKSTLAFLRAESAKMDLPTGRVLDHIIRRYIAVTEDAGAPVHPAC